MKNPKIKFSLKGISSILCLVAFLVSNAELTAQSSKNFSYEKNYKDYTIPSNASGYAVLTTQGGDGGKIHFKNLLKDFTVGGGGGAYLKACFKIGNGANALKPGSTLRFIVGGKGESKTTAGSTGAGGGGGSAIAYKKDDGKWDLLMVAGGGGASGHSWINGKNYGESAKGYAEGLIVEDDDEGVGYGGNSEQTVGGGGGAFGGDVFFKGIDINNKDIVYHGDHAEAGWPHGPDIGEPTGGACKGNGPQGGWGFGAGGDGDATGCYTGGGGGYIGGDSGDVDGDEATGGISYLNRAYAKSFLTQDGNRTSSPSHGYAEVEYSDNLVTYSRQVQLTSTDNQKCLTNQGGKLDNNNNIYSINCGSEESSQQWFWDDNHLKVAEASSKCLDIKDHGTSNGTNIRIWDCMDHNEQRWIYDGLTKQFRSFLNLDKCMDASLTNGSNVKLWGCSTTTHQKWDVTGATTISEPTEAKYIVEVKYGSRVLQSISGAKLNSNVQLGSKSSSDNSINWVFDGQQIQYGPSKDLCLGLDNGSTASGTNIKLMGSASTSDTRQWIYNGLTKQIRSVADPNKCIEVETTGLYKVGSNLKLMDCTDDLLRQQFDIINK